jgi:hypothetical protein
VLAILSTSCAASAKNAVDLCVGDDRPTEASLLAKDEQIVLGEFRATGMRGAVGAELETRPQAPSKPIAARFGRNPLVPT